jgi:beta-galactosidase
MLPHAGTKTRIWREVVELGADLPALAPLRGTSIEAQAALLWDWPAWWALELEWCPSIDLDHSAAVATWYERLWRDHLTIDFAHPSSDLSRYPLVIAPSLYLLAVGSAENLASYVRDGGTLVVSYFSGVVDETDAVHLGGAPGPLRDVLGLTVDEALPLRPGERVRLSDGGTASSWAETLILHGASATLSYLDGPAARGPAVTRHAFGSGTAWYVSTRPDSLETLLPPMYADAGLAPPDLPDGVEVVRRSGGGVDYLVAINHTDKPVELPATGTELLRGERWDGVLVVPAGDVRVLRLP